MHYSYISRIPVNTGSRIPVFPYSRIPVVPQCRSATRAFSVLTMAHPQTPTLFDIPRHTDSLHPWGLVRPSPCYPFTIWTGLPEFSFYEALRGNEAVQRLFDSHIHILRSPPPFARLNHILMEEPISTGHLSHTKKNRTKTVSYGHTHSLGRTSPL